MTDTTADLDAALRDLERLPRKARPSRLHARAVLLALGSRIEADRSGAAGDLERVLASTARFAGAWSAAIQDELALACTEHVRSVDPRYLSLPNYDLGYTLEARERLGLRLTAARALGAPLPARTLREIDRADRLLAEHLARVAESESGPGSQGAREPEE
jgi:hypothetical protein